MDIGVLGAGSWGAALSVLLSNNRHSVTVWSSSIKDSKSIKKFNYLNDIKIPKNVHLTSNINNILNKNIILIALPSHVIKPVLNNVQVNKDTIIVNCSKGFDLESEERLSIVISEELKIKMKNIVFLSGPSHAEEVIKKTPTAVIAAGTSKKNTKLIQEILSNNYFRVYQSNDMIGAEIGASCKNIISIASGICVGLGYGDNTIAALISRGLQEIVRLGCFLKAEKETFYGLSGLGDLTVTAFSDFSRNRQFGKKIGMCIKTKEALEQIGMLEQSMQKVRLGPARRIMDSYRVGDFLEYSIPTLPPKMTDLMSILYKRAAERISER